MPSQKSATKPRKPTKSARSDEVAPTSAESLSDAIGASQRWHPKIVPPEQKAVEVVEQTLEEAFPDIDPGLQPFGSRVLLQIRTPRQVTRGGILLPHEVQDTEKWNTTIAKVISLGPGAFKNRDTLQVWPEGEWAKAGDFVWCPKYAGQRHELKTRDQTGPRAMFVTVNDLDLIGSCTIDPRTVIMFI